MFVAVHARHGAVAERITNPNVQGAPRPVEPLFGFGHWLTVLQVGTLVFATGLFVGVVVPHPSPHVRHAQEIRGFDGHPAPTTFAVMFVINRPANPDRTLNGSGRLGPACSPTAAKP